MKNSSETFPSDRFYFLFELFSCLNPFLNYYIGFVHSRGARDVSTIGTRSSATCPRGIRLQFDIAFRSVEPFALQMRGAASRMSRQVCGHSRAFYANGRLRAQSFTGLSVGERVQKEKVSRLRSELAIVAYEKHSISCVWRQKYSMKTKRRLGMFETFLTMK